jgi:hypothetical protein
MHTVASQPKYTIPFIDLLATIAAQGGVALENARMRRNLHVIVDIAWPALLLFGHGCHGGGTASIPLSPGQRSTPWPGKTIATPVP